MCDPNLPYIIREALNTRTPKSISDDKFSYRHASVLIPLFEDGGIYKILFTKRTDKLEEHKGQISFPGGSVDKKDISVEETALREASEEVGISKEDVEILGRIDDTLTLVSNFVVHPFVGLIPYPYDFIINNDEVERLISVPLKVFHPSSPAIKGDTFELDGKIYHTPTYEFNREIIWGATARMMKVFMDLILDKFSLPEECK
ncbi:MAG TPA: CoA pyrophosphatase [Desulfobacteraceae bacterium]|nr:CoA pyrophosphatase [Desulfobacteraceae bacterium]HPJ67726.1 CoA pyrophosphatase [Desulfobacteraceae bacterium]HPQ29640.1 CoA pyrophosphatase [Desulfobacteraceae bacterium]